MVRVGVDTNVLLERGRHCAVTVELTIDGAGYLPRCCYLPLSGSDIFGRKRQFNCLLNGEMEDKWMDVAYIYVCAVVDVIYPIIHNCSCGARILPRPLTRSRCLSSGIGRVGGGVVDAESGGGSQNAHVHVHVYE